MAPCSSNMSKNTHHLHGEKKVFHELNAVIMNECPEFLYERDLVIEAIYDVRLRMRACAFSHQIMGKNGEIHLANHDYRLLLGLLSSTFERSKNKKIPPKTLLLPALQQFEAQCQPGAQVLVERITSLLTYESDGITCSSRTKLRDVIRLLELSYPLGTSMTDPHGGKNMMLPTDSLLCIKSREKKVKNREIVEDKVRLHPVQRGTAILSTSQELGMAYAVRTDLENDNVARAGPDWQFKKFFNRPLSRTLVLQPEVHLGVSLFPGTIVIVRLSDRIVIMMKNVLSYATHQEQLVDDENGNVNNANTPTHLSSVTVCHRDDSDGFDPNYPDVQYLFYDREQAKGWDSAFGSTIRSKLKSP